MFCLGNQDQANSKVKLKAGCKMPDSEMRERVVLERCRELFNAIEAFVDASGELFRFRQHLHYCEINQTDFCTCGLKQSVLEKDARERNLDNAVAALRFKLAAPQKEEKNGSEL